MYHVNIKLDTLIDLAPFWSAEGVPNCLEKIHMSYLLILPIATLYVQRISTLLGVVHV